MQDPRCFPCSEEEEDAVEVRNWRISTSWVRPSSSSSSPSSSSSGLSPSANVDDGDDPLLCNRLCPSPQLERLRTFLRRFRDLLWTAALCKRSLPCSFLPSYSPCSASSPESPSSLSPSSTPSSSQRIYTAGSDLRWLLPVDRGCPQVSHQYAPPNGTNGELSAACCLEDGRLCYAFSPHRGGQLTRSDCQIAYNVLACCVSSCGNCDCCLLLRQSVAVNFVPHFGGVI